MPVTIEYSANKTSQGNTGVETRHIGQGFYLNQANGTPVSLSPGLPSIEDQFAQMGVVDLRAHDWYGLADIDTYFDPNDPNFIDQITNNAPDNLKSNIKTFAEDFFNRRTIVLNAPEYISGSAPTPQYNWEPTDTYLKRSLSNSYYTKGTTTGAQKPNILFRIGRMINGGRVEPSNVARYCDLVKAVVERYTVNYQQIGLPQPILEYEIWNEPDLGLFWSTSDPQQTTSGNAAAFYSFYEQVANAIKSVSSNTRVGPCGVANAYGNKDFVDNLVNYIKQKSLPFDFYSYHFYADQTADPRTIQQIQSYVRNTLNNNNYSNVKCYISEWNLTAYGSQANNTKVQSIVNAAFILSFLINAEQAGVDKAYLYRADTAEFGLFNDQTGPDGSSKNFATYAAQAIWLYNKFASTRFSSIINKTDTSKTGITTTGAINQTGNQILILVSNYKVDTSIVGNQNRDILPSGVTLQAQHYIDSNNPASNIDSQTWYGTNAAPQKNNNKITNDPLGTYSSNQNSELFADTANYTDSATGYTITVTDIPTGYSQYTVTVRKVFNNSQLTSLDGETVVHEANQAIPQTREIIVKDNDSVSAGSYTLALITIDLA
ncbi:GH39 family glycosyl hydrolase [Pseudomonas aeruginosa]|nr:hypothetical protein [Pseudomonas aeruginosa]